MKKYDEWNDVKKNIEKKKTRIYFKEREIYWANIGENIGSEQNGKGDDFTRPLLIFKRFSKDIFFGIPLSTQYKDGNWFFQFSFKNEEISTALLVQSRLFDIKRLDKKIGKISVEDFRVLKTKFKELMNV